MKKQMFGAILLSAALAMGTAMPAFAVDPVDLDDYNPDGAVIQDVDGKSGYHEFTTISGNEAATDVFVQTRITQINVTVPMKVVLAAQASGGALQAPTTGAYQVTSQTAANVYIQKIVIKEADPNAWALPATSVTEAPDNCKAGARPAANVKYGNLYVKMSGIASDSIGLKTGTTTYTLANAAAEPQGRIPAKTAEMTEDPGKIFNFSGSSSILNNLVEDDDIAAAQAFTITYTVSVQPNTATTYSVA